MSPRNLQRPIATAVAFAFLATSSGCVTNADGSFKKNADGTFIIDEKAKSALIGAAAGCAMGAATSGDCAKGAVIGAVAGLLIGWYFESKKIASAQTVNKEYVTAKKITPPKKDIVPASFTSNVVSAQADASGQKEVQITSNTDLIGYGDKVPEVQQKYAIYDENNKRVEEKTEKLAAVDGAGRYTSKSKFKLPANAKGNTYTVKTTLVSNNTNYNTNTYKVAFVDDGHLMVLAAAGGANHDTGGFSTGS